MPRMTALAKARSNLTDRPRVENEEIGTKGRWQGRLGIYRKRGQGYNGLTIISLYAQTMLTQLYWQWRSLGISLTVDGRLVLYTFSNYREYGSNTVSSRYRISSPVVKTMFLQPSNNQRQNKKSVQRHCTCLLTINLDCITLEMKLDCCSIDHYRLLNIEQQRNPSNQ
jgi:hypothetical protein